MCTYRFLEQGFFRCGLLLLSRRWGAGDTPLLYLFVGPAAILRVTSRLLFRRVGEFLQVKMVINAAIGKQRGKLMHRKFGIGAIECTKRYEEGNVITLAAWSSMRVLNPPVVSIERVEGVGDGAGGDGPGPAARLAAN